MFREDRRNPSLTAAIILLNQSICSTVKTLNIQSGLQRTPQRGWLILYPRVSFVNEEVNIQKSVFRHGRRDYWLEKQPGTVICLTRLDHSAALRGWRWRKWDSRVLTQTKLDTDLNFWETSRCPDGPSSCLTSDNRETNAKAEQSSILTGFIGRRAAKIKPLRCVMMWYGETFAKLQM